MTDRELEHRLGRLLREPPPERGRPRIVGPRPVAVAIPALAALVLTFWLSGALLRGPSEDQEFGAAAPSPAAPTTASPECGTSTVFQNDERRTVDAAARVSAHVWIGTVVEIGTARSPVDPGYPDDVRRSEIYRPLTIAFEKAVRGGPPGVEHEVRYPGGTIGCITLAVMPYPVVEVGRRYVFVLTADCRGDDSRWWYTLRDAWPIADDGFVATPRDGTMTLDQLEARVSPRYVPNEVLVKFRRTLSSREIAAFAAKYALANGREILPPPYNWHSFEIRDGMDAKPKAEILRLDPWVESATLNFLGELSATGPTCPPEATATPR